MIAKPVTGRASTRVVALTTLGLLSTMAWAFVARMPTSNRPIHVGLFLLIFALLFGLYFGAVALVRRPLARGRPLTVVLSFAVLFRLFAVLAGLPADRPLASFVADLAGERVSYEPFLLYDNDLWRYLWDGHLLAEGLNPYLVTPRDASEEEALEQALLSTESWRDVHAAVSFRNYGTIYPPLIHYFFAVLAKLAPASAGAAKLTLSIIDLLLCLVVARALVAVGRRRELVVAYAWNPAAIKEFSGTGHPDVLMMLALVGGVLLLVRGRSLLGGAAVATSILAKLASILTLPLLALWTLSQHGKAAAGRLALTAGTVLLLGLWPLAAGLGAWLDAFQVFAERWTFNSGFWAAARWLFAVLGSVDPQRLAHGLTRWLIFGLACWVAMRVGWGARLPDPLRSAGPIALFRGVFWTLAALILLSPTVMPWYVLWALPVAVVTGNRWWPVFTGLALLSYLNYADGVGAAAWWKWLEYGGLAIAVGWDLSRGRRWRQGRGATP